MKEVHSSSDYVVYMIVTWQYFKSCFRTTSPEDKEEVGVIYLDTNKAYEAM